MLNLEKTNVELSGRCPGAKEKASAGERLVQGTITLLVDSSEEY